VIWLGSSGFGASDGLVGDVGEAEIIETSWFAVVRRNSGGGLTGLPISISFSGGAPFAGVEFEGPGVRGVARMVGVDFTSVRGDVVGDSRGRRGELIFCM
jgi:hypothetical protein